MLYNIDKNNRKNDLTKFLQISLIFSDKMATTNSKKKTVYAGKLKDINF